MSSQETENKTRKKKKETENKNTKKYTKTMHAELGSDLRPNCKVSACITFIGMFGLGYLSKDLG
jgi:hypothetical protein